LELMGDKYRFFAPSHSQLDLTNDEQVRKFFRENHIDYVIQSAMRPAHRNAKDPSRELEINLQMFFNLARNSERFEKLIFIGSGELYDIRHFTPKMKEEYFDSHVPADEGGFSKYIASKYIKHFKGWVDLRVFGVFGKYEDYAIRFISNAICKALSGLPITIKINRRFDYVYINDLMPVLEYFLENRGEYFAYNVTPDQSIELLTLAEIVRDISGKDLPILIAQPGMGCEYSGSNERLKAQIPGLKYIPITQAIRELYQWYETNYSGINRECLLFDK